MNLSVVTATYNVLNALGEPVLRRCVESIARLEVEHEHIIKDGGSTDGTLDVLLMLQKATPGLRIVSERDNGIYDALNVAIEQAQGEWVYIIGADDYIIDGSAFVKALSLGIQRNVDMVASPVMTRADGSSVLPIRPNKVFTYMPYPHQGLLMRRSLMRRLGGFDLKYRIASDCDLELRALLLCAKVLHVNQPYTLYATTGFSSDENRSFLKEYLEIGRALLGLRDDELGKVYPMGVIPLRVILRHLFGRSAVLRSASWHQAGRWLADRFGLIDKDGVVIVHKRRMVRS